MSNIYYFNNHIELSDFADYSILADTINDLVVNGIATKEGNKAIILYEDLAQLDEFEHSTLKLPNFYPFDIFIDIKGSGLKDLNLKLTFSFQDFAHKNGSGNILFNKHQLKGAYLKNNSEYLLSSSQFLLIKEIEKVNSTNYTTSNEVLKAVGNMQAIAYNSGAILSRVLVETIIITPDKFKIEIEKIGDDKFRLKPAIENIKFQKKFGLHRQVKKEYNYKENDKKIRVVIDDVKNEDNNSIQTELEKLKKKNTFSSAEINDVYNSPSSFWDEGLIDLDEFGERVLELGIYKPKFYPFISPYKSQWIPGIAIEDKKEGIRHIAIKDKLELIELKNLASECKAKGGDSITFKGEKLDIIGISSIIENAEKQLKSPKRAITTEKEENEKSNSQTKVLIIKENTEQSDYDETGELITNIEFDFRAINNLSYEISLKDHQKEGIAWLQTLSTPPYSLPGVLLADDMGLGKTLQVLYFTEWYVQNIDAKPMLIVAPLSLLENWQNEYAKFFPCPNLNVVTLWGSNVKNYIISSDKEQTINNLTKKSFFLTTYETLRKQQIPLGLIDWGVVILDEAQKIKTPGTFVTNAAKALKSDFKIAMTGTPVENTLMDLWCIVDFCRPGLLENAKAFHSQFQKPLEKENVDYSVLSDGLRKKMGQTMLRRMKDSVAKDLPTIEPVKYRETMPVAQLDIYMNEIYDIEHIKETSDKGSKVLQGILNLRSISDHPYLKHFQLDKIGIDELINVSAKLKKVIAILEDIKKLNEKVILFTENKSMQRVLRRAIGEHFDINPSIINGEVPVSKSKKNKVKLSRQQEIDKYQEKSGFNVIIMSPIAAGFGLNITEANHVIHYTRHWNPAKEQQATDRVYRIGQKRPVKVYYPFAVSPNDDIKTFDLILDELLSRKSNLASNTLFPTEQIEIGRNDFIKSMGVTNLDGKPINLDKIESLDRLEPLSFESAIALLLEKIYGGVSRLTVRSNDKGADIVFFKDNENLLVQVKQSTYSLGINSCQEISYALSEYTRKYDREFKPQVITNSRFTKPAIALAKQNNVELLDRKTVSEWINRYPLSMDEIDNKLTDRRE